MRLMRTTSGLGSPRFFAFTALIGLVLAALPGAVGAKGDALVRDAGIESMVWLDANEDGMQDKQEVGVPDVNVSLLSCDGQFLAATRTDARGRYRFDVAQGCYRLRFAAQADMRFCPAGLGNDAKRDSDADPATGLTSTVNVTAGMTVRDINAGVVTVKGAQLGDRVWEDTNANGIQDVGEKGLGDVTVQLLDCAGGRVADAAGTARIARSDADGYFVFDELRQGCYRLQVQADDAWQYSARDAAIDSMDSDIDPASGLTQAVNVSAGGRFDLDAGLYRLARIGDWVWFDTNADGVQNKDETGVAGIEVLLLNGDGVPTGQYVKTDARGYFEFTGVQPGDYRVQYVVPAPYRIGKRNQGIDVQLDSDANSLGTTRVVTVGSGAERVDVDLGLFGGEPVDIAIEKLTNGVDADEPTGPVVEAGDDVMWEYIITNTGDADLFEVAVVDDQGVSITCPSSFLATGETFTCTGSTDDAQAGQYMNSATVCGNDQTDEPQEVCATDVSHYFGSVPGVTIETLTQAQDADTPTGPEITVGTPVSWEYVVTNTGNTELTNIVVVDDQGVTVTCPSTTLAPGVSMTCTASGTATPGQYMNVGSVVGTPPVGADVDDTDPSHYFGIEPLLSLQKTTNGVDADTAPGPSIGVGETVTWEYTVTNEGNVAASFISVTDDQGVVVSCPPATIPPGGSITCIGTGIAQAGPYMNIGTACGTVGDGIEVCASDPSHYTGLGPMIDIETLTQNVDADDPTGPNVIVGLPVTWDYVVTNTGGVALTDIVVVDDQGVAITCPATTLEPGASFTCSANGTAEPGQYANVGSVTASGNGEAVADSDPSHYFGIFFDIEIEKDTNGADADVAPGPAIEVGQPVTWTYVVTNTGNVQLNTILLADDQGVAIDCPQIDFLNPGDSLTCTATGTAQGGQYQNIGSVCGFFEEEEVCDTDPSHYFGAGSGLSVEKSTNGEDADTPTGPEITEDDPVNWTYVVTNTGNVTVNNIVVTDDQGVAVACPTDTLAPGASLTCTGSGIATVGQYANIGSATGQPVDENGNPIGDPVGGSDPSHYLGTPIPVASIGDTVFVDIDRDGVQDAGEPGLPGVTVNLWVDDDGDGTPDRIIATVITDANGNYIFADLDPRLTYFIQFGAVPGQPFTTPNVGDDTTDSDADPATGITPIITLTPGENNTTVDAGVIVLTSAVSVEKTTNGEDADTPTGPIVSVGDPITWTYVVTNDGELTLIGIVVTDSQGVAVSCPTDTLAPGESLTCTGSGVATPGQYSNIGTVTGQPSDGGTPVGDPVTGDDPSHYFGAGGGLTIEKSTNGEDADTPTGPEITEDDAVNWTYVVTNTGNVAVNDIVVTDDQGVTVSCPADTLAPGASLTCTGSGIATVGQYANIGSATGQPVDENGNPIGDPVGDTDPSHYLGTPIAPASIGDTVFVDTDRDGIQGPGEPGLPGVTVNLWVDDDGDGTPDRIIATVITDANGNYLFSDLDPRLDYYVQFGAVPGQPFTTPNVGDDTTDSDADPATGITPLINLTPGENNTTVDAGVIVLTSAVSVEKTTNGQDADTPTGPIVSVGDPITWTYVVTNDGELTLTGIVVTDNQGVDVSCPSDTLAPGESLTCTGSGVATAGQYSNIGTVTGQPSDGGTPVGDPVTGDDPSHYFGAGAGLTIEKSTNGEDADTPTGPEITEDDPVNWTYVVTNTGNVSVNNIVVTDDQGVTVSCPADTLAPGASLTCTGTGIATVGQYANIGSATGQPVDENGDPIGDPVGDTDPSHYLGTPIATASISDTVFVDTDRDGVQDPGEPGLPGVTVNLWVDDDGDGTPDRIIATVITDANGNYIFADLDPRLIYYVQFGAVPGQPFTTPNVGDDTTDSDADPATGITPAINLAPGENNTTIDAGVIVLTSGVSVEKRTNGQDADTPTGPIVSVGDPINWTYVVTNDGELTLTGIVVTDDQGVVVSCPADTLAPGESFTCTGSGVATAGQYSNIGSVTGQPSDGGTPIGDPVTGDDPSHYFGAGAGLTIEKSTNGEDADTPTGPEINEDDPVNWTYVVTNTGNVTVNNIVVTDDQGVAVSCPADTLAPGASLTCTASGTATLGQYANIGSATGQPVDENGDPIGDPVGDTDPSHYLGTPKPVAVLGDRVFVDDNRNGIQDPGESGVDGRVVNLWVDDDGDGTPDRIIASQITDQLGNYLFTDLDPDLVYFVQFVPVPGQPFTLPNVGSDVTDSDADPATGITGPIVLAPGETNLTVDAGIWKLKGVVGLQKFTNGQDADAPTGPVIAVGDPVAWTYVVTNNGELLLEDIVVTDNQGVVVTCPATSLAVGESMTCTGSGIATAGQYANLGSVSAQPVDLGQPVGDPRIASDPSHYFGAGGGLNVEKSTNGEDADTPTGPQILAGSPVLWQYVVTNTGNVTVTDILVTDSQGVSVSCPSDTLAPGASLTCTGNGVAVVGQYMNLGSASGQPVDENGNPIGAPVGGSDPSHYLGLPLATASIGDRVFVDADRDGVQDPVEVGLAGMTVNLWVDDDGDGTPDRIIDTQVTDASGNYLFTNVDASQVYFVQFVARPGLPFTVPNIGDDATDSDADPATGISPAITLTPGESNTTIDAGVIKLDTSIDIEKATNGEDADTPTGPVIAAGDPVNWTYVVTNTGELDLVNVTVTDNQGVAVSCPGDFLAGGESFTCTATGIATLGQYQNIGTVSAQPNDGGINVGNMVGDNDLSHYFGQAICTDGNVADHFGQVSYDNSDGDMRWNGPWVEHDPQGGGPDSGAVFISNGQLIMNDRPDSGTSPSIERAVDLSGFAAAMLKFDWSTSQAATRNDKAVLEVSSDGGLTFVLLDEFASVEGQVVGGSPMYDLTPYISSNTIIRLRISHLFGGNRDKFLVDNVRIDKKCTAQVCVPGDVADHFDRRRYNNNDGSMDWASRWKEHDPRGGGASDGSVRIKNGMLMLDDYPNSGSKPSIRRTVDLSGYPSAMLMFNWSTSEEVDASDEVTLKISSNGGQSYTVLDVFRDNHGAASGFESYDISAFIATETTIKFVVTNKFGGRWEKFMIDNVRIDKKCDADACVVTSSTAHAIWLPDFNGDGQTDRFDLAPGASFTRAADGTARLTGIARNRNDASEAFMVDVSLAGGTATPPAGSPKNNFGADISDWYYYPQWEGSFSGLADYEGAQISFTRRGPSFQIGTGANDKQDDVNVYGGSGWFDFTRDVQGDRCLATGHDCITQSGHGDFNVRIDCGGATGQVCVANETQRHALYLPNFNNDGVLDRYDLDDGAQLVQNPNGTARLTGLAYKQGEPNYRLSVDLMLSGRTSTPPPGSPYNPQNADPSDWIYYPNWSGTLTGDAWNTGARISVERRGASFQLGTGANAHPNEQAIYGGSGWFDFATSEQPNDCHYYGDCIAHSGHGDVNVQLMCPGQ